VHHAPQILYKPEHLEHIYDCTGKAADVREPDREKYPTFDRATPYEVVLEPGDLLFVPAGWAHQVECVDDSISLTHNFLPKQNFSAVRACLLANRLGKTVQERKEEQTANPGV
jgi:dTDP-4-dehydrorhamnose 3,5-epimerase-like enzyme